MKILVCICKTPDTTAKVSFINDNSIFDENGVQFIINPYDEWYALVRAIELKEADSAHSINLITVGSADLDPIIRKCFALGGDEAFRINCSPKTSLETAFQLSSFIKENNYDLILCGKESIDFNNGLVGPLLAEYLNMPFFGNASNLILQNNLVQITCEVEGGQEIYESATPLIVGCQKGMAEQRIPNMRNIMSSRTKPLKVVEPKNFENNLMVNDYQLTPPKTGVKTFNEDELDSLVDMLHHELKLF